MFNIQQKHHLHIALSVILLTFLASSLITSAQASARTPITSDNADQIKELITFEVKSKSLTGFTFSPDGSRLLLVTDGGLQYYDLATGKAGKVLTKKDISQPSFNPDGTQLAGHIFQCTSPGNCSSEVSVIDAETGKEVFSWKSEGLVDDTTFSPDGKLLAYAAGQTGRVVEGLQTGTTVNKSAIHIVDIATGKEQQVIKQDNAIIGPLFFNGDGSQIAYTSLEWTKVNPGFGSGELHMVGVQDGKETQSLKIGGIVRDLNADWTKAFFNSTLALPGVMFFGMSSGVMDVANNKTDSAWDGIWNLSFNPASTLAAISGGSLKSAVSVWDTATSKEVKALPIKDVQSSFNLAFSADGTLLAAAYVVGKDQRFMKVWSVP